MANIYLPTLKQLQYLVALRDYGHFGKAADACFVTQSTLSAGLRELESLLGVMLVERTRRVVRFTPLGERIADRMVVVAITEVHYTASITRLLQCPTLDRALRFRALEDIRVVARTARASSTLAVARSAAALRSAGEAIVGRCALVVR